MSANSRRDSSQPLPFYDNSHNVIFDFEYQRPLNVDIW